jgi:hypothetical protein
MELQFVAALNHTGISDSESALLIEAMNFVKAFRETPCCLNE